MLHSPLIIFFNQFQKRAIKTEPRTFTFMHSIQPQFESVVNTNAHNRITDQSVAELSV